MRVLAIDTALAACSAAVRDTGNGGVIASESAAMERGHAEALMPLLERVVKASGLAFADFERIVVTTGPGSFTGLRVGIAAARGLGVATHIPVVGVTTLSAYAAPYLAADDQSPVIVAIDARHEHVYLEVFGPGGRTLIAPRLAPLGEAIRAAAQAPARIVGSAAQAVADGLVKNPGSAASQPIVVDARRAPDIGWVAKIGAAVSQAQAPPKPQYLRAPDAQPQYAAALPRR
jgi:tRNA threonylcarbamoyladenosine biosynthesis protein TsaB